MMTTEDAGFLQRMERIEKLVADLDQSDADPKLKSVASELVSLVMELHGTGMRRVIEIVQKSHASGTRLLDCFAEDPLIGNLMVLHDAHPEDLPTRIGRGLAAAAPYLKSHGGNVELVSVDEGQVVLRLTGNCHGCPSSMQTMKNAIEDSVYDFAPDVVSIELEAAESEPSHIAGFVALESLG